VVVKEVVFCVAVVDHYLRPFTVSFKLLMIAATGMGSHHGTP
jgi:hypothetical protein